MLSLLLLLASYAGSPVEDYQHQHISRQVHDSRKEAVEYVTTVQGEAVVSSPQTVIVGSYDWWIERDGVELQPREFAEAIGDKKGVQAMDAKVARFRRNGLLLMGVGVASGVGLAAFNATQPDGPADYTEGPAVLGPMLGTFAAVGIGVGGLTFGMRKTADDAYVTFYTEEELDAAIQAYNEGLARKLGVSAQQAARYPGYELHKD